MAIRQGTMENLVNFWRGKQVFITGHTGFKGAWLCATLLKMGANITGYSLPSPTTPNLFETLGLAQKITHIEGDIRHREQMQNALKNAAPEIVFHMAAQSLVRYSYKHPLETFDTNITGTLNLLEAARNAPSIKSLVVITTDKCYLNHDHGNFFHEADALGGKDPYSASKAAAEIVTHAYYQSFLKAANIPTATARAGNVIGGGDWAEDRLIPDIIRAFIAKQAVAIRNPNATRPWQFVLEPLGGYMLLAEKLFTHGHAFAGGWNFGPEAGDIKPVGEVITLLQKHLDFKIEFDTTPQPVEAKLLALSIDKAKKELGWGPKLSTPEAIAWTGEWYKQQLADNDITAAQIERFFA